MTNLNDEILHRGSHAEIRIVVFNDIKEVEGGNKVSNIGFEVTDCPDCLTNAMTAAINSEGMIFQMFAAALAKAYRIRMSGQTPNHLELYRHDKNGINPNLN